MKTRNRTLEESFWARTDKSTNNECWLWNGTRHQRGYGMMWHNNRNTRATHISLYLHNGEWPTYVMHLCDNPPCVNPAHLKQATHEENMKDKVIKGRHHNQYKYRTHCSKGHEYIEGSYWFRKGTTYRICRECHNAPRRKV